MANIRKIEAKKPLVIERKKVAAYARVSRDTEVLLHSLSAQISHYSSFIQKNPDWEYVGVYVDEGITGTSTEKRDSFKKMIKDCEAGKIDMILVKSISRFARNTVDLLKTVRYLKSIGVEVWFEREQINSSSGDGELMLSILASFAQEESRNLSENVKWGIRKGFEKGKPHTKNRTYGYVWNESGYEVIPEEAEIVNFIFEKYLEGISTIQLAKLLEEKEVMGVNGNPIPRATIKDMLKNEMYIGNLVLQKRYAPDIRKQKRNYGELPMYRVEEAHEAIVNDELFYKVQEARTERGKAAPNRNKEITCFSGKVKCGKCGYKCSRRNVVHSKKTKRVSYKRWVCNCREMKHDCDCKPLFEDELIVASKFIFGNREIEDVQFNKRVDMILQYDDKLEFHMTDGSVKTWKRE